ncbi:MAG: flagellar hook assembly protein FlgD [Nitrospirae bacterium]|nr:flagellar hook assembly protein FlgD [Nitrospirota bacterium]MCL5978643.1 flagellar hook assembly protein FlgD [Nitrospirota bacterium]
MATTAPIFSNSLYTKDTTQSAAKEKSGALDQDAFLKLLIAQLKNQDPLNPMKDTEFIAQLASFSSLEQTSKMNRTMEQVMGISLIGMKVKDSTGVEGTVKDMSIESGKTYLTVAYKETDKDGNKVDATKKIEYNDIKEIKNPIFSA